MTWGDIIWDQGDNFRKFIHWGSHRATWIECTESFLSVLLTRFRKNHNTQQFIKMRERWKEAEDTVNSVDANIFMNLSFDILNHDLLIGKLEAYGFSLTFLRCIRSYVNQRLQRTGVNNNYLKSN